MTLAGFKAANHPQQTAKRGAADAVDDRGTDPEFIATLEKRFGAFTLDVAAAEHNAKAPRFYTRKEDGLAQSWADERVWCNPPYSDCGAWVRKAWSEFGREPWTAEAERHRVENNRALGYPTPDYVEPPRAALIVMLLPANRVEQRWWQDLVEPYRDRPGSPLRVEFLPGRMRFIRPNWTPGPKGDRPPFGCALLIWDRPSLSSTDPTQETR